MKKLPSGKLDISLIALDLDDTLLNNQAKISQKNIEVLRRCAALGIYIVLCSGRAESGILPFVRALDIAGLEAGRFIVAINGSSVFDLHKRQQIHSNVLSGDLLLEADDEAAKSGLDSEVYTADTIFYGRESDWTLMDVKLCGIKGQLVEDYKNFLKKGFSKMLVAGEAEKIQDLQKKMKARLGDRAEVFTSKPVFLEIMPKNVGKGEALLWLASYLGLDAKKTIAFGDGMNDENMILRCGSGVAMKNAVEHLKNVATYVTEKTNDEDGVADFIEKYIL